MLNYWGVVPAAGCGERFGKPFGKRLDPGAAVEYLPKQYAPVAGARVIEHSLAALICPGVLRGVVVSLAAGDTLWSQTRYCDDPRVMTCQGGANRTQSVMNALHFLRGQAAKENDWIVVHDAVRPCLSEHDFSALMDTLGDDEVGGLLVAPVSDTLKRIDERPPSVVAQTLERSHVRRALTPQMFRFEALAEAIGGVLSRGLEVSDEAQAMELAGHAVRVVEGDGMNIKLTYPHELPLLEAWLTRQMSC